jgi:hypothetical protein
MCMSGHMGVRVLAVVDGQWQVAHRQARLAHKVVWIGQLGLTATTQGSVKATKRGLLPRRREHEQRETRMHARTHTQRRTQRRHTRIMEWCMYLFFTLGFGALGPVRLRHAARRIRVHHNS